MPVQAGLCRTCSKTTLLVIPRGGSYIRSWSNDTTCICLFTGTENLADVGPTPKRATSVPKELANITPQAVEPTPSKGTGISRLARPASKESLSSPSPSPRETPSPDLKPTPKVDKIEAKKSGLARVRQLNCIEKSSIFLKEEEETFKDVRCQHLTFRNFRFLFC